MAAMRTEAVLFRLLSWNSPAFPVGAFSYSHGIERAVEAGGINDAKSLERWIDAILAHGGGRNDAILFACASRAAAAKDWTALGEAAQWAAALRPTGELAAESVLQGEAFLVAIASAWRTPEIEAVEQALRATARRIALPIAAGGVAGAAGLPLGMSLAAYVHAFVANLISAGLRLIPLGQSDGQRVLASLEAAIASLLQSVHGLGLDDLGGAALMVEISSMQHETQYTRLFRS
jgi:urease accessory protein